MASTGLLLRGLLPLSAAMGGSANALVGGARRATHVPHPSVSARLAKDAQCWYCARAAHHCNVHMYLGDRRKG